MAEILVRVVDKVNEDFYLNCACTKRGDVIVVAPDGWKWGTAERADSNYRIISLPQYSVDDLQGFLARELPKDPTAPNRTLQKRAFKFDVDHPDLPDDIKAIIADDTRASDTYADRNGGDLKNDSGVDPKQPTVDTFDVLSFKVQKPAIDDPAVIGPSPAVIG